MPPAPSENPIKRSTREVNQISKMLPPSSTIGVPSPMRENRADQPLTNFEAFLIWPDMVASLAAFGLPDNSLLRAYPHRRTWKKSRAAGVSFYCPIRRRDQDK